MPYFPLPLAAQPKMSCVQGAPRHWILEIHFVDRANMFSGCFEELLTIGPA
jgi:hypothetical protein